jgi:hypothetical protein
MFIALAINLFWGRRGKERKGRIEEGTEPS